MKDSKMNRRDALKLAAGSVVAIPLSAMFASQAMAGDLPHLAEDDPMAVGLKYKADATQAERVEKAGVPGEEQACGNCQLATSHEGEWLPCQLFPGKAVAATGWCSAWAKKM